MDLGIPGISGASETGRGLGAITYPAVDDATGQPVIVKVLQRDATPEVRARFDYDQARLEELAEHPNVVRQLRHGYTAGNQPYIVRADVHGSSMADRVGSGLDGPGVLALGIRVAGALESAHRRDVVHGALDPTDILIDAEGEPEVADFGIAMVTGQGPDRATDVAGLAHASPEQVQTHVPSAAGDVYSLASVLYALLAGRPAFVKPGDVSVAAVGARILTEQPEDLRTKGVPDPVVDAIDRALQKDPAARWTSAEAFGLALQQAEITLGVPITPMTVIGPERAVARPVVTDEPAAVPTSAPPAKKGNAALVAVAVLLLVAAGVGGFFLLSGDDDGGGDDVDRTPVTRADVIELTTVTDDSGAITVGVIETWNDVDGRPLVDPEDDTIQVPDVVAAADAGAFLTADGFAVSGIEVTTAPGVDDAEALLDARVGGRGLDDNCTTDLPPAAEEVAGFVGLLQRFEGCDGNALVVFAGVQAGTGLVAEVHLVEDEDEAALQDVLDSIEVSL